MTLGREPRGRPWSGRDTTSGDDTSPAPLAGAVASRTTATPLADGASRSEHYQPALWLENEWTGEIPVPYGVIPY